MNASLIEQIDALLPQVQCTRCGFRGCEPYARALACGEADINRCPPAGDAGIRALARLLGRDYRPLDPACGEQRPQRIAVIDEALCIGCTICIQACPVDAIVGASGQMHTVVEELCSGCDLCVTRCPIDCIAMAPAPDAPWSARRARSARRRFDARVQRLARERAGFRPQPRDPAARTAAVANTDKQAVIREAMERARARRSNARRKERA